MSNFVWETEEGEEKEWPNPEEEITVKESSSPTRKWVYILPILALLIVTIIVIYNQFQRRVAETEAAMTADIISTFELAQLAAAEQDEEMLTPLLSGRDLGWVDAQLDATAVGTLFDRASFGLQLVGEPTTAPYTTQFNEQLDAAELTIEQPYQDPYGNTIILERTFQFRSGADRWLWSPLDQAFWGEDVTTTSPSGQLEFTYPERDEQTMALLMPMIEQQVAILCTDNGIIQLSCDGLTVQVQFEPDPAVLVGPTTPRFWVQADGRLALTLPTPTLIGKPRGQTGHRALARAYTAPIITQIIVEQRDYVCCVDGFAFAAVIDHYLERAQIRPYPLTTADYQRFFREPFVLNNRNLRPENNQAQERIEERQQWRTQLTVNLILSQTEISPDQLLTEIHQSPNNWLDDLLNPISSDIGVNANEAMLTFAAEQGQYNPAALHTALPQGQTIISSCAQSPNLWNSSKHFQQYDWQSQTWQPLTAPLADASSVAIMPDDQGLLWTNYLDDGSPFSLLSQYGSQVSQLYQTPSTGSVYFGSNRSINSKNNFVFNFYSFDERVNENLNPISSLSSAQCQNGNCALTPQAGFPVWSPNETNVVMLMFTQNGISLTVPESADSPSFSTPAVWPYIWLDETNIIYRVPDPDDPANLTLDLQQLNVESRETAPFLTAEQVTLKLPTASTEPWRLLTGQNHPIKPEIIAFIFEEGGRTTVGTYQLLFYNWQTAEVEASLSLTPGLFDLIPSPNGRWLLIDFFETEADDIVLNYSTYETVTTFNGLIADNQSAFNARYDWSADSNWLVQYQRGYALLYTPATDETYPLLYPNARDYCYGGGWWNTP